MIRIPNRTLGVLAVALCVSAAALTTAYAAAADPAPSTAAPTGANDPEPTPKDSKAPPAPVITSRPPNPTTVTSATFTFADSEARVSFQCRVDRKGAFSPCASGGTVKELSVAPHLFEVRAVDQAGNVGAIASTRWTIQREVAKFAIRGSVSEPLTPGKTAPMNLAVSNPYAFAIVVRKIEVTPRRPTTKNGKPNPACDGRANLRVTPYSGKPFSVQPNRTVTLAGMKLSTDVWPQVTMRDLTASQAACRDTAYTFTYSARATK